MARVTGTADELLVVVAWAAPPGPAPPPGWRREPVLADQSALDRAGNKGRTPPPFHALLWAPPGDRSELAPPPDLEPMADRWGALRLRRHARWDDTAATGARPALKQVSFVRARPELTPAEFDRHYREHADVARVHHPAIVRYAQLDVVDAAGDPALHVDAVSELWFLDEEQLVARYYAGPDSIPVVRADNREYIDFSGTLSLLVEPADPPAAA